MRVLDVHTEAQLFEHTPLRLDQLVLGVDVILIQYQGTRWPENNYNSGKGESHNSHAMRLNGKGLWNRGFRGY